MNTPPPLPSQVTVNSLFHKAATGSLFAIPLAIAINIVSSAGTAQLDPEMRRTASMTIGLFAGLLLLLGFISGIVALFGIPKYGKKGILWKALLGSIIPALLMALAIPAIMTARARAMQLLQTSDSVDAKLAILADSINKKAPVTVDADTILVSAKALPNRTIQYHYTTTTKVASDFPRGALKETLFPSLLKAYQSSPDMVVFRDNKVTIIYRYTDRNGQIIDQFTIAPDKLPNE